MTLTCPLLPHDRPRELEVTGREYSRSVRAEARLRARHSRSCFREAKYFFKRGAIVVPRIDSESRDVQVRRIVLLDLRSSMHPLSDRRRRRLVMKANAI